MFERFTDRARRSIVLAQRNARELRHNYIGTEHLLLGLVDDNVKGNGASRLSVLDQYLSLRGIDVIALGTQIRNILGVGDPPADLEHPPFTPRAKSAIEAAVQQALRAQVEYIATEHLLLGLLAVTDGFAARFLRRNGFELRECQDALIGLDRSETYARDAGLPSESPTSSGSSHISR